MSNITRLLATFVTVRVLFVMNLFRLISITTGTCCDAWGRPVCRIHLEWWRNQDWLIHHDHAPISATVFGRWNHSCKTPPPSSPQAVRYDFPCFRELNIASRVSFPRCPRNSRKIGDSPKHNSQNPLPAVLTAVAETLHPLHKFGRGRQRPVSKGSLRFVIGLLREIWISPF